MIVCVFFVTVAQDRSDFYLLFQCPIQFRLYPRVFIFNEVVVIVQSLSCVQLFATLWTAAHQASLSFTVSQSLLNLCPLSQWCYLTISSSATPLFFCPQSFPASVSRLFISGVRITEASASVLPVNEYSGWFPLGLTGLISFLSKESYIKIRQCKFVSFHVVLLTFAMVFSSGLWNTSVVNRAFI